MIALQTAAAAAQPVLDAFHAVILGIVEGVTEFLPVSSTAHLILASRALGIRETEFLKSFEIIIQLGAILSVVVLYWRKFLDFEVLKKLVVAVIPTGVIGLTVYKAIKGYLLGNVTVVLTALVIGGIALLLFSRRQRAPDRETDFREITYGKAFLIGLFQAIAVIPGVSRSAATIVGGSLIGVSKRTIVEFSFMLAVPTMLAASGLELIKNRSALQGNLSVLGVGFVVSFITAIVAIKSFLSYIKNRDFSLFGWYRIALAIVYYFAFLR
ncbi:MAG TPA: undecaprenyl-diphosphate phosphatase [Gemmatimonadaceae bacterium]|nr:undecaprenyl-diphosphate phosphatase [Gemmatimonadaceae bacterium]